MRSRPLKAFIYSMPIPITLVMLATNATVTASHLIGVVSLVLFFFVVAWLILRLGWHTLPAVAGGVVFYLLVALGAKALPTPAYLPTLAVVVVVWIGVVVHAFTRGLPARQSEQPDAPVTLRGEALRLGVLTVATFSLVFLGRFLGGFAVTFPYSGILVSFGLGSETRAFARNFAIGSISLVAFFTAHWLVQDSVDQWLELVVAWASFFAVYGVVALLRRTITRKATTPAG